MKPMFRRAIFALALMFAALPLLAPAQTASPPAPPAAVREWLFEALRTAPTEEIGDAIAGEIRRFWMAQAPDDASAELMKQAMVHRRAFDFAGAMKSLDRLVEQAPSWPEAWNQRATVLFFQEDYERSLADVAKVLALEPNHFGALAGKAIILMRQGDTDLGQKALREALAIHPWLRERRMLLPEPPGQKL